MVLRSSVAFSSIFLDSKETLATAACIMPDLSTLKSILPFLTSVIAFPISFVTVPDLGFWEDVGNNYARQYKGILRSFNATLYEDFATEESEEDFAWYNKCDSMELIARPGWEKIIKRFGYKKSHVLLEKHNKEKK